MQIELFPYERRVLEVVEREFSLERELVVGFAQSLNVLCHMFEQAVGVEGEFKTGRIVIIGIINYTHHLIIGGLQALQSGNGPVWSTCVRSLIETFGACALISDRPETTPNFLEHVKPGKLRAAAERAKPGLGVDIDRLNRIVHPGSGAIFSGFKGIDYQRRLVNVRYGPHLTTADEGREGIIVLANLIELILEKLEELLSRPEVLLTGKTVMVK